MRLSRIAYIFAAVVLALACGQYIRAHAPSPAVEELPKIVQFGLETYKSEGPEAAIKAWVKGGPYDGNKDVIGQASVLRQAQGIYGTYRGYEVIRAQDVSAPIRVFYLSLNFDRGPVFSRFIVFRSEQGAMITALNFSAKPEDIVPNLLQ
ncbi:MAG TPA: hypothetical protein VIH72_15390 [Candidatus Acidoferrales bacterium]